jgi:hypothetical protein
MDDGVDLGPGLVDRAVNEALEIARPLVIDRRAIELELDDVLGSNKFGSERARQQ